MWATMSSALADIEARDLLDVRSHGGVWCSHQTCGRLQVVGALGQWERLPRHIYGSIFGGRWAPVAESPPGTVALRVILRCGHETRIVCRLREAEL